jgi:hypothetical protein
VRAIWGLRELLRLPEVETPGATATRRRTNPRPHRLARDPALHHRDAADVRLRKEPTANDLLPCPRGDLNSPPKLPSVFDKGSLGDARRIDGLGVHPCASLLAAREWLDLTPP